MGEVHNSETEECLTIIESKSKKTLGESLIFKINC